MKASALYVLQSAGLIKLDTKDGQLANVSNIKENPKDLKISELDASQTPSALPSVDAAVINNTFVREAGVDFKKAIYVEKKDNNSKQWYNVIAAKKDGKNHDKAKQSKKSSKLSQRQCEESDRRIFRRNGPTSLLRFDLKCMKEVEKQFSTSYRVLGGMHAFCNRSGTNP